MSAFELALVVSMAAITFAVRYSFFALPPDRAFPAWVGRGLDYVPVAVLTAIVVPMVVMPAGAHWQVSWRNAWLVGALATGVLAWRFNKLLPAIAAGFAVYAAWRFLLA
jgi:branched-subunit amino acid transport protein